MFKKIFLYTDWGMALATLATAMRTSERSFTALRIGKFK